MSSSEKKYLDIFHTLYEKEPDCSSSQLLSFNILKGYYRSGLVSLPTYSSILSSLISNDITNVEVLKLSISEVLHLVEKHMRENPIVRINPAIVKIDEFLTRVVTIPSKNLNLLIQGLLSLIFLSEKNIFLRRILQNRKESFYLLVRLLPSKLLENKGKIRIISFLSPFFEKVLSSTSNESTLDSGLSFNNNEKLMLIQAYAKVGVILKSKNIFKYLFYWIPVFGLGDKIKNDNDILNSIILPLEIIFDYFILLKDNSPHNRMKEKYVILFLKNLFSLFGELDSFDLTVFLPLMKRIIKNIGIIYFVEFLPFINCMLIRCRNLDVFLYLFKMIFEETKVQLKFDFIDLQMCFNSLVYLLSLNLIENNDFKRSMKFIFEKISNLLIESSKLKKVLIRPNYQGIRGSPIKIKKEIVDLFYRGESKMILEHYEFFKNNYQSVITSLNDLKLFEKSFNDTEYLLMIIGISFFIADSVNGVLNVVKNIMENCNQSVYLKLGLFFQPLLLYKISKEEKSEDLLELIYYFASLGTENFFNVNSILNFLNKFTTKKLDSIKIRLFLEIWKGNKKFFPVLKKRLEASQRDSDNIDEVKVSVCFAVKEVCRIDGHQGLDLLKILTDITMRENNEACLCLGLQALTHLCEQRMLNVHVVLRIIKSNITKQTSIFVERDLCKLFQHGVMDYEEEEFANDSDEENDDDEFDLMNKFDDDYMFEIKDMINLLLKFASKEDDRLKQLAYESLSKYPLNCLLFSISGEKEEDYYGGKEIENEMKEMIGESEESEEEDGDMERKKRNVSKQKSSLIEVLNVQRQLFLSFSTLIYQNFSKEKNMDTKKSMVPLLKKIVQGELYQEKKSSTDYKLDEQKSSQQSESGNFQHKDKTYIAINHLFTYSLKNVTKNTYFKAMNILITNINKDGLEDNELFLHNVISLGFNSFMKRLYFRIVEIMMKDKKNEKLCYNEAFELIYKHIIKMLSGSIVVPSNFENLVLSLNGLCLSLPSFSLFNLERVIKFVTKFIEKKEDDNELDDLQENIKFSLNLTLVNCFMLLYDNYIHLLKFFIDKLVIKGDYTVFLCFGIIGKSLFKNTYVSKEENKCLKILMNFLFKCCYQDEKYLFEIPFTYSKFIEGNIKRISAFYDKIFLSFIHCFKSLIKVGEIKLLLYVFEKFLKSFNEFVRILKESEKNNFFLQRDQNIVLIRFYENLLIYIPEMVCLLKSQNLVGDQLVEQVFKNFYFITKFIEKFQFRFLLKFLKSGLVGMGKLSQCVKPEIKSIFYNKLVENVQKNTPISIYSVFSFGCALSLDFHKMTKDDTEDVDISRVFIEQFEKMLSEDVKMKYSLFFRGLLYDRFHKHKEFTMVGENEIISLEQLNQNSITKNLIRTLETPVDDIDDLKIIIVECFVDAKFLPSMKLAELFEKTKSIVLKCLYLELICNIEMKKKFDLRLFGKLESIYKEFTIQQYDVKEKVIRLLPKVYSFLPSLKFENILIDILVSLFDKKKTKSLQIVFLEILKMIYSKKSFTTPVQSILIKIKNYLNFNSMQGLNILEKWIEIIENQPRLFLATERINDSNTLLKNTFCRVFLNFELEKVREWCISGRDELLIKDLSELFLEKVLFNLNTSKLKSYITDSLDLVVFSDENFGKFKIFLSYLLVYYTGIEYYYLFDKKFHNHFEYFLLKLFENNKLDKSFLFDVLLPKILNQKSKENVKVLPFFLTVMRKDLPATCISTCFQILDKFIINELFTREK